MVDNDEAGAVAVGQQSKGGRPEAEAGDGAGRLVVDPRGQTDQRRLVARRLLHRPRAGLQQGGCGQQGTASQGNILLEPLANTLDQTGKFNAVAVVCPGGYAGLA
jgi:hypothetical protein